MDWQVSILPSSWAEPGEALLFRQWSADVVLFQHTSPALSQEQAEQLAATLYADRPVGKLSGGEQQRLLLAQALLGQPKLLLLDGPLASLDLKNQHAIAQLVAQLAQERGITKRYPANVFVELCKWHSLINVAPA